MTTRFEVGDNIWWLDTRSIDKPRIRSNVILEIEWEKYYSRHKYVVDDNRWYIWSPNTVVAKTYEELINILYPPKIGQYDYNQFVYVIETNGHSIGIDVTTSLVIDKGYIKQFSSKNRIDQCLIGKHKDIDNKDIVWYDAASIYTTIDAAKYAIDKWLDNNDN